MLTAKDVREVKFPRAMGGYKTSEVDDFLDLCADTIEELTNQKDENTRKMQVLAETIVEYRNQEDSIRAALISAQRMSESVLADANAKAEEILSAAREEAATMHDKALADTAAEQEELVRVRKAVAAFKSKLLSIYREHLTMIGVLEVPEEAENSVKEEETTAAEPEVFPDVTDEAEVPAESLPSYREVPDISAFELDED